MGFTSGFDENLMSPWWVQRSRVIYIFPSLISTQDTAHNLLSSCCPASWTWVRAEQQTGGRGQHHRLWISPEGGLYQTLICFWPGQVNRWLSLITALGVTDALAQVGPFSCQIKWANDILLNEKKMGGILIETVPYKEGSWCLIGIGLNINTELFQLKNVSQSVTSLKIEEGGSCSLEEVGFLIDYCLFNRLKSLLLCEDFTFLEDLHRRLSYIGQHVYIKTPQGYFEGTFYGLNAKGQVILDHHPYDALRLGKNLQAMT